MRIVLLSRVDGGRWTVDVLGDVPFSEKNRSFRIRLIGCGAVEWGSIVDNLETNLSEAREDSFAEEWGR